MTDAKTRPASAADSFQKAKRLAKAGRKEEARDALRGVVGVEPANQAAWLWLSALAPDRAEAEAALTQARRINPAHPRLAQAEQWLTERFPATAAPAAVPLHLPKEGGEESSETLPAGETGTPASVANLTAPAAPVRTEKPETVPSLPAAPEPKPPLESKKLLARLNSVSLRVAMLVTALGLVLLLVGVALEVGAADQSDHGSGPPAQAESAADLKSFMDELPTELDMAWRRRDWDAAITILEKLHQARPTSQTTRDQLSHAYLQKGIALRHQGFIEEALVYFEHALNLTPDQRRAKQEFRLAASYLAGSQHHQAGRWAEAISALEMVWAEDQAYVNLKDLLYSAYYNRGLAMQAAGELPAARASLAAAITFRPDLAEPRRHLAEVEFALAPETPLETPLSSVSARDKTIVVGISEQRMLVYEGQRQIHEFVVSTGEPGRDTAIGDFEIQNKIDMAYASTWNLDMPYWLGIYWSGPLQNGIHALPIVKHTGYKLWDGYLGQRVSYGCVILSDEDAATLYEWAEVGARVKIVPSLAYWSPEEELN